MMEMITFNPPGIIKSQPTMFPRETKKIIPTAIKTKPTIRLKKLTVVFTLLEEKRMRSFLLFILPTILIICYRIRYETIKGILYFIETLLFCREASQLLHYPPFHRKMSIRNFNSIKNCPYFTAHCVVSKLNLTRPDRSPARPGAKMPTSMQKSRQVGRAIRPVRSVWIVEIKEKRPAIFFQMPGLFLHFLPIHFRCG